MGFPEILLSLLFGVLAVLILAVLAGVTLLVYFRLRQKHPESKLMNEIIVMGGTILVSFVARFVVAVLYTYQQNPNFDVVLDGMSNGLFALFALVGGMTFEGTYAPDELYGLMDLGMNIGAQILYYGAVAYAGVSALLILSTAVSYEVYSFFKLMGFMRRFDVVYIFTDVAEESIIMAQDIEQKEKQRKKRRKFAILFMGSELEAFDHKNELHREIMDRGYIYWSYAKVGDKAKEGCLIKKMRYKLRWCQKRNKGDNRNKMVHIFALRNDEKLCAAENHNSDVIFGDISALLADYCKGLAKDDVCKIPTPVNYYLLTHGDINYEFYNTRCNEIVDSFFEEHNIQDTDVTLSDGSVVSKKKMVLRYIQMHILSEAKLTGDDLVNRWQQRFLTSCDGLGFERYRASTKPSQDNVYRTAIFGFGKTGQYALKSIFVSTSNVSKETGKFVSAQFIADVYDVGADHRSGEFAYAHPLFLCKVDSDNHTPLANKVLIDWGKTASNDALDYIYAKAGAHSLKLDHQQVWEDMAFPIIDYHRVSCLRQDFMNQIDGSLGIFDKQSVRYNSFVVSMGNDEDNLIMANILIDDFKHEILLNGKTHGVCDGEIVTIFVHIRDEKNTHRLNWSIDDEQFFANCVRVVTFGCREHIWSYNNIVDDENASMYNYMYNVKSRLMEVERGSTGQFTDQEQQIMSSLANGDCKWVDIALQDVARKDSWLNINAFTKESNRSAFAFALNYCNVDEIANREYCERLEHLRWNRFHMANGWIYADYGKTEKVFRRHNKEHNCLCPYDMLDEWIQAYDLVNVQVGKILFLDNEGLTSKGIFADWIQYVNTNSIAIGKTPDR